LNKGVVWLKRGNWNTVADYWKVNVPGGENMAYAYLRE
jgi:hypothetical protein